MVAVTDDTTTRFDPWHAPSKEPDDDLVSDLPGGPDAPDRPDGRRWRVLRWVLVGAVGMLAIGLVGFFGGVWYLTNHFGDKIERIPNVFEGIPEAERPQHPVGAAEDGQTFLLAGSDQETTARTTGDLAEEPSWVPGLSRSDAIMLVHLTSDRDAAYIVSIPRDTWVEIPGRGMNKINAAYSFGGPSLYIQTVEDLTGVRIDHLAVIDWEGFKSLTDAVGGVTIDIPPGTVYASGDPVPSGEQELDGQEALDYVRQRYNLPGGDFDRIKRQQNYLRALMSEVLSRGTLTSPGTLNDLLNAIGDSVSVDDTLSNTGLRDLALGLRDLRNDDVTFLTAPVSGVGQEGSASVVYLDDERAGHLWEAIKSDDLPTYIDNHAGSNDELGEVVN